MLDIDALNDAEGENWVWGGSIICDLGPDEPHDLALLKLSRGGADACVIREFNLDRKEFVTAGYGGFFVNEAKTQVSWKSRDVLLIGTAMGEGSLTDSGYARTVLEWKRGTPLSSAIEVFAGEKEDVAVVGYSYFDRGFRYEVFNRSLTFYTSTKFVRLEGGGVDKD